MLVSTPLYPPPPPPPPPFNFRHLTFSPHLLPFAPFHTHTMVILFRVALTLLQDKPSTIYNLGDVQETSQLLSTLRSLEYTPLQASATELLLQHVLEDVLLAKARWDDPMRPTALLMFTDGPSKDALEQVSEAADEIYMWAGADITAVAVDKPRRQLWPHAHYLEMMAITRGQNEKIINLSILASMISAQNSMEFEAFLAGLVCKERDSNGINMPALPTLTPTMVPHTLMPTPLPSSTVHVSTLFASSSTMISILPAPTPVAQPSARTTSTPFSTFSNNGTFANDTSLLSIANASTNISNPAPLISTSSVTPTPVSSVTIYPMPTSSHVPQPTSLPMPRPSSTSIPRRFTTFAKTTLSATTITSTIISSTKTTTETTTTNNTLLATTATATTTTSSTATNTTTSSLKSTTTIRASTTTDTLETATTSTILPTFQISGNNSTFLNISKLNVTTTRAPMPGDGSPVDNVESNSQTLNTYEVLGIAIGVSVALLFVIVSVIVLKYRRSKNCGLYDIASKSHSFHSTLSGQNASYNSETTYATLTEAAAAANIHGVSYENTHNSSSNLLPAMSISKTTATSTAATYAGPDLQSEMMIPNPAADTTILQAVNEQQQQMHMLEARFYLEGSSSNPSNNNINISSASNQEYGVKNIKPPMSARKGGKTGKPPSVSAVAHQLQARRIARAEQRALAQLDPPPRPDSPSWDNMAFLSLSEDEESRWTEHVAQPRRGRLGARTNSPTLSLSSNRERSGSDIVISESFC